MEEYASFASSYNYSIFNNNHNNSYYKRSPSSSPIHIYSHINLKPFPIDMIHIKRIIIGIIKQ